MKRLVIILALLFSAPVWAQAPPQGVSVGGHHGGGGGGGGSGTVNQGAAGNIPYYPALGTVIGPATGTPHGVFLYEAPNPPTSTAAPANEQLLVGVGSGDPQFLNIGGDITATTISGNTLLLTAAKVNGALPGGTCSGATPFVSALNSQAIPTCMSSTTSPSFRGFTLLGSVSGSDTISVPSAAGTGTTFVFPANNGSAGQFLQTDGTGTATWANPAGGGTVNSGTMNQLGYYASTGTAITGNSNATIVNGAMTLGVAGTAAGKLTLSGATSGTFALATPASTTTYTLTVPSSAGAQGSFLYSSDGAGTLANLTAGASGTLLIAQGASVVPAWHALSGDCTIANTGAITCTATNGVAFAASATTNALNASNISSGTLPAARLPNPSASTLGGVESLAVVTHNWINTISTSGVPAATQPASTDLSDLPIPLTSGGTQCAGTVHFASLPGSPVKGTTCSVDNATTCTAGTPIAAGGGSTYCQVVWDGSAWQPAGGASSAATGGVTAVNASAPITSSGGTTPTVGITVPSCPTSGGTQALNFSGSAFSCNPVVGTIGGTSGQIEYNNAGSFGGFTASGDATINTSTGAVSVSKIGGTTPGGTCSGSQPLVASLNGSAVPTCMATTITPHFGAVTSGANGGTGGSVVLNGGTSGSVTVAAAANAGTATNFTLPGTNGTANQFLQTDGSGNTSWQTVTGGGGGVTSITAGTGLTGGTITTSGTIALSTPVSSTLGGSGVASPTAHGIMLGEGASAMTALTCAGNAVLNGVAGADPICTVTPQFGVAGASTGTLRLAGVTSGVVTIQPASAAGTYNFNLPNSAGTAGQPLLSGGGGAGSQTYGTLAVGAGGTGVTSGTSGGVPYFASSSTMGSSAALTANQPVIGGGAGNPPTVGSKSGNTNVFGTTSGTLTNGDCGQFDGNGNIVDSGAPCGGGGGGGFNNTPTTITGTTAGTAKCYTPIQQSGLVDAICQLNGYLNTTATPQTYTFGTTFVATPYFLTNSIPLASTTTSALSLPTNMMTTFTGWIEVRGTGA